MDTPAIPHSREAEEALLGSLIINPSLLPEITLNPKHFYIHRHQWIFSAMRELDSRGIEFDLITLSEQLEKHKQLEELGGFAFLTALINQSPSSYNATHYADIIKDKAGRRDDIKVANMIAEGAFNGGVDRAKMIDMLTKNTDAGAGAVPISSGLAEFSALVEERAKNPCDVWGIETGLVDLDKRTGGLHKQQTTMIVGAPGVGKTTLMLQIALNAAKQGIPGAIYELEMDMQPRLLSRLMFMLEGIPTRAMMSGRMDDHWRAFTHGLEVMDGLKLYICDNPVMDTIKIRADVARLKAQKGIEFLALDYLNLLTDKDGDSSNDNTTAKAIRFRQMCREFDVTGFTIQSMNKEGMKSLIPHLADMSGPAEVAFSADNVFFLVEEPDKANMYKLLPAKQRDGDMGNAPIQLIRPSKKLGFQCTTLLMREA